MNVEIQSALISAGVSILIAVLGWWIASSKAKEDAKNEKIERDEDIRKIDKKLKALNGIQSQLDELKAQTAALERANELAAAANPANKAPWGDAEWTGSGSLFRIHHEGTRNVVVTSIRAKEDELQGLFILRNPDEKELPKTLEPGDSIEYMPVSTMAGSPTALIEWHWEGSQEIRRTERRSVKPR